MNWQAISFDWNQVRAFLATAEEGSFSAAARVLRTTQPTIGRQIAALEDALEVTLLERSVRGQQLTTAGRELLTHVRAMGDAATQVSLAAQSQSQDLAGEVTITATDLMSAMTLPGVLTPLRKVAPAIRVRIVCSNDLSDLMQREADIAIRHIRPEQSELIARHVGNFTASLYAATAYLDKAGRPRTPREIADHAFVGNADPARLMAPLHQMGIPVREENFVMSTQTGVVAWELVKAGYGVSMQPSILGDAEPGIEKVFPGLPSPEFPLWLVTHRELRTNPPIRIVFDTLSRELAGLIGK